jgi:DNA polymerase I
MYNYLIPREEDFEPFNPKEEKSYRGAIVLDPLELGTVGLHFDVWMMDFSSLYPTIIDVRNLSYETINCGHEECKGNSVPELPYYVCKKQRGILALMFGAIRTLRVRYFKPLQKRAEKSKDLKSLLWYQAVIDALRIVMNAGYGVFGDRDQTDLYFYPIPASITAYGRQSLAYAKSASEGQGAIVLYGHTDSLMLKNITAEKVAWLKDSISKTLNVEFDIKGHYVFVCISRAANYLCVRDDGEVEIKGLMAKKSHVPNFIQNTFDRLKAYLSDVKTAEDFEKAKRNIVDCVREALKQLKSGKVPLEDLAIKVTLSKDIDTGKGQDYNVARMLKKVKPELNIGDTIRKIYTKGQPNAMPMEMINSMDIVDINRYVELMKSVLGQILEPMGLDLDWVFTGQKQAKIVDWS